MSRKQFFCRHEYALYDTHLFAMVVACKKCGKILAPDKGEAVIAALKAQGKELETI